jgi:hypothetical protein
LLLVLSIVYRELWGDRLWSQWLLVIAAAILVCVHVVVAYRSFRQFSMVTPIVVALGGLLSAFLIVAWLFLLIVTIYISCCFELAMF